MGERTTYMEVELGREGLELISVVTKLVRVPTLANLTSLPWHNCGTTWPSFVARVIDIYVSSVSVYIGTDEEQITVVIRGNTESNLITRRWLNHVPKTSYDINIKIYWVVLDNRTEDEPTSSKIIYNL